MFDFNKETLDGETSGKAAVVSLWQACFVVRP